MFHNLLAFWSYLAGSKCVSVRPPAVRIRCQIPFLDRPLSRAVKIIKTIQIVKNICYINYVCTWTWLTDINFIKLYLNNVSNGKGILNNLSYSASIVVTGTMGEFDESKAGAKLGGFSVSWSRFVPRVYYSHAFGLIWHGIFRISQLCCEIWPWILSRRRTPVRGQMPALNCRKQFERHLNIPQTDRDMPVSAILQ